MDYEKIVLVTRKTRLDGLVERFNTRGQAKFYLEHAGGDFSYYEHEHETYYAAVAALRAELSQIVKFQEIERGFLPNFVFAETDMVVTIGIDGLVVNTAKYLNGQPIIAVNPDPAKIDGVLLPFSVESATVAARQVLKNQFKTRQISMAQACLNDGQSLLAFNDLFVGVHSHTSARYLIRSADKEEHHSSSGVIISTGVGSTGWLSSLFNMANGLLAGFSQDGESIPPLQLDWEADQLVFVVREPFASKTSAATITCGRISPQSPLTIESEMPVGGVIFSDGVESDFLAFNAGAIASIKLADKKTHLVIR
ncbi:MAG: NAD+ kinase [Chloroflexota bacterium]